MSGILSGFTFNGKHCMNDFGLLYVESDDGRTITPARRVNEYEVAGTHGTIRFPGETYGVMTLEGALYPMRSPADDMEAQRIMRDVAAWLYGPRGQLIFDYEPERYLIAEVVGETKWTYQEWLDGGLGLEFRVQPFAYAVRPGRVRASLTEAGDVLMLPLSTGQPAPLEATITNTSAAALTGVTIIKGSMAWSFSGLEIPQGGVLKISNEPPIGAVIIANGVETNALPHSTAFDMIYLGGVGSVSVSLTFDGGAGTADVELSARGRWL